MLRWLAIRDAITVEARGDFESLLDPQLQLFRTAIATLISESESLEPSRRAALLCLLYAQMTDLLIDFRMALSMIQQVDQPSTPHLQKSFDKLIAIYRSLVEL